MPGAARNSTREAPRKSLRTKFIQTLLLVAGTIGVATILIVSLMTARASADHLRAVQQYIEEGIASKGKVLTANHALALRGLTLDNAFLDMQRLLERAVKDDGDLVYGVYVSADRETLALAQRSRLPVDAPERDAWRGLGLGEKELIASSERVQRTHRLGQDLLEVAAPVVGENGELLGTLRYGLSTRRMHDALLQAQVESSARLRRSVLSLGLLVGLTVLLGLLVSRSQAVRITRPIGELTVAAHRLAAGDRAVRVDIRSRDELELLGASFNQMVADLDASYGTMAVERSRQVSTWFGDVPGSLSFWQYLSAASPAFAEGFEMAWSQLAEDFLPVSVCLAQLPARLTLAERTWNFRYLPFFRAERLEGVLVAIEEVTLRLAREHEDAEHYDLMQAFRRLVQDRAGFEVFLTESSELVASICERRLDTDPVLLRRAIHTLKGNSSSMGLSLIAELCHTLETELSEQGEALPETLSMLAQRWKVMAEHVASSGAMHSRRMVEIPEQEYVALLGKLANDEAPRSEVLRELRSFEGESVEKRFRQLADRAGELARRSGKGDLRIAIDAAGVRVDGPAFAPFFSELIHVVRNAIDHGIETPEARAREHKPAGGALTLRARRDDEQLEFEIADDGAGVDWDSIRQIAAQRGLPHLSRSELLDALCEDGVTTRSEVSELSGRGVGMAAFRDRVLRMNGELEVRSTRGAGTSWLIRFPGTPPKPADRISLARGLLSGRASERASRTEKAGTG